MLMDKRTYLDISEKTGASTATISRVNRSLNYGNDGYEMVFSGWKRRKLRANKIQMMKGQVRFTCPFLITLRNIIIYDRKSIVRKNRE